MLELFANPAFLVAGGALVSAPIIIHLINRMRFKRLRWAAMEFLLKAQKRSRRRLIIEQLILLLLRCLLVALAALLVLRFLGLGLGDLFSTQQENLHEVIIDDTVSQNDQFKDADGQRTSFDVARKDVLLENILKNVVQSTTNDRVAIIQLSRLATEPDYRPRIYERQKDLPVLIDGLKTFIENGNYKVDDVEIGKDIKALQPGKLHVPMVKGVEKAAQMIANNKDKRVTVHVVSDFRKIDWGPEARPLHEALLKLAKAGHKVQLHDTAHPFRLKDARDVPAYHDNVGIVDIRPNTRVTGAGMPVRFTITVQNFTPRESEVFVKMWNDATGGEMAEVDFNERMPLKVPAGETATCSFEKSFFPELKENQSEFISLSARLESAERGPLINDGLPDDNVRHVAVEIRKKVPVLVVDGLGPLGRKERGDSYFLEHGLLSAPGSSYEVVHADKLTAGDGREALEAADLSQYPSIVLLNVPSLTKKQIANLGKYVRQGGGLGFFLGPNVDAVHYNKDLYKDGKGIFPVPLEEKYFPARGQKELPTVFTGRYHLLLRDDQFPGKDEKIPIFGPIYKDAKLRDFMKYLPVRRYWPALPVHEWKGERGKVREIVNLPNEKPIAGGEFAAEADAIAEALPVEKEEYKAFQANLKRYQDLIYKATRPTARTQTYQLAEILKSLLNERGSEESPGNLAQDFWTLKSDPKIPTLVADIEKLRRRLLYSHPMFVTSTLGQGRVVAVMTTAGKEWNDWADGSIGYGSYLYPSIVWEMQTYLSSQSGATGLMVGAPLTLSVDRKRHGNKALKVSRHWLKTAQNKVGVMVPLESRDRDAEAPAADVQVKGDGKDVKVEVKVNGQPVLNKGEAPPPADPSTDTFTFRKSLQPGLYISELRYADDNNPESRPLFRWGHVYNVDARKEGRLQRVSMEELDSSFLREGGENIQAPTGPDAERAQALINKQSDLSESPWFFLLFIGILVAEQALAVHLSFHLKGTEAELPSQVVQPHATKVA